MKESGMEKLIELLNEYDDNNWGVTDYGALFNRMSEGISDAEDLQVLSKKFGFIKRLVEKEKIETNNLSLKAFKNIFSGGGFVEVSDLEVLLMLLAISDTPIEDLISYLKIS